MGNKDRQPRNRMPQGVYDNAHSMDPINDEQRILFFEIR